MIFIGALPVIVGSGVLDLATLPFRGIYHAIFDEKNEET